VACVPRLHSSVGGIAMARNPSPLQPEAVKALQSHVRGQLLLPDDVAYGVARRCWNASVDRRPAGILRCEDAEDVTQALRIATEYDLPVTVRGGGHNVAGRGIADEMLQDRKSTRLNSSH